MAILKILKLRKRRLSKSLAIGLAVCLLTSLASYIGYFDTLGANTLDFLFWLRGRQRSPEIIIVKIDDEAFRKLNQKQPLPRSYLASLIKIVGQSGAKVIAVDIELTVSTRKSDDAALLEAIHGATQNGATTVVPVYSMRPAKGGSDTVRWTPMPFFSAEIDGIAGFANASIDSDGIVRQLPLVMRASDGRVLPSLSLAALARYAGANAASLKAALNSGANVTLSLPEWDEFQGKLRAENTPLSFDPDETWRINYIGPAGSFKAIPSDAVFMFAKQTDDAKVVVATKDNFFFNKIVMIGETFAESRDFFPTPKGLMSGVEIHANSIHTLLSRSQILTTHRLAALLIALFFAAVMSVCLTLFSPLTVTIASLLAIPTLLVPLSYLAFAGLGLWVDFVTPLVAICGGIYAGNFFDNRRIRRTLEEYVDRTVAGQIIAEENTLGGQKQEVTVFFSDIRNYTTLCEGSAPEKIVGILNELFTMMSGVITKHDGWIVDYIGDAVLAVFGAPKSNPQHADAAVLAAKEILDELARLNTSWQERDIAPLKIGVGIHSGEVVVGVVGSGRRKKFTVTGDTVNTGSRIEGLNKDFGTSMLISRETLAAVNGKFEVKNCGAVTVKGRTKPVEVFEVLRGGGSIVM